MEETNTVIGLGAGAMSKRVFNLEHRIERQPNVKFIEDYIARIDEMIEKKKSFISKIILQRRQSFEIYKEKINIKVLNFSLQIQRSVLYLQSR